MVYLKAWLDVLAKQASNGERVTLLDHGPIYRLAALREFGPEITRSHTFERWWRSLLKQWTATLDIVICLDAPDLILLERIRARDSWHAVKDKNQQEACDLLTQYRIAFEQTMAEFLLEHPVSLLRFDTHQESVDQILDKTLATFDSLPNSGNSTVYR